jgi:NADH-quinone oxidoreductase subunit J
VLVILSVPGVDRTAAALPAGLDTVTALGMALVSPDAYVLPFEVASVLMLAALVGAVYVATVDKK